MVVNETSAWVNYMAKSIPLNAEKCGKWMYFFAGKEGLEFASEICRKAVENGIVCQAKHTNIFGLNPHRSSDASGVACFYLNCDDTLS